LALWQAFPPHAFDRDHLTRVQIRIRLVTARLAGETVENEAVTIGEFRAIFPVLMSALWARLRCIRGRYRLGFWYIGQLLDHFGAIDENET
jgi:hypothetical protein